MEDFNYVASFPHFSIVVFFFCRTDGLDWSLRYSEVCILCLFLPEGDDDCISKSRQWKLSVTETSFTYLSIKT